MTYEDIAEAFEKDVSTVRRVVNTQKVLGQRQQRESPLQLARDLVARKEMLLSELAQAAAASDSGSSVRVAALAAKGREQDKLAELLQKVGFLPHDLTVLAVQLNGIRAAEQIIEVLEEFEVPEEAMRRIEAIWSGEPEDDEDEDVPALPGEAVEVT